MSSLVNKSGVRFAPKIGQRRSVASTPTVSRRASVTPSLDSELKKRDDEEKQDHDEGDDSDSDASEQETEVLPQQPEINSRRPSIAGPLENKQRRLSTLSNTTRSDFLHRKNSVSSISNDRDSTAQVITQPERPRPGKPRNRRSTTEEPTKRTRSTRVSILTPPATQQTPPATQQTSAPQRITQPIENELPPSPTSTLSKAEGKTLVHDGQSPLFVPQEDTNALPTPEPSQIMNTSSSGLNEDSQNLPNITRDYLIFDSTLNKIKKVSGLSTPDNALRKYDLNDYKEVSSLSNNLEPDLSHIIKLKEATFKMADLCKPSLPIGRVSSNFQLAQKAQESKRIQRSQRRQLREKARIQRRSLESYEDDKTKEETKKLIKAEDLLTLEAQNATSSAQQSVQLKIGLDGNIIVDEESRVVDRHANIDMSGLERHDENPFENLVNSATYGKQRYSDRWDNNERELLYQGLYQWGTDFGLIAQMFPYRTRRQIKSKFILEEKKNPHLVELALSRKLNLAEFNLEKYSENSNRVFDDLDRFNEKISDLQKDHQENLKELSVAREKAKEEDLLKQKKQELEMRNGWNSRPMTRKERMSELRKHETVLGSIEDIKKQREEEQVEA
jgi:transcription factor TFIIIB component B''